MTAIVFGVGYPEVMEITAQNMEEFEMNNKLVRETGVGKIIEWEKI